ncbi:hypothetical protein ZIOFF_039494 [Zingiber officinale]|uniref:Uncharacterized protein n=1 Tax=Zingiber officinale TaxID=94328 RepID=A0A8J5KU88_ZINOF|nr:hypothetical protein ZIOFF_039494 [Zingiber officinale]
MKMRPKALCITLQRPVEMLPCFGCFCKEMPLQVTCRTKCRTYDGGFANIHIAASVGDRNMIEEILVHYPDALEQKNNQGRNFVHVAVEKKNLKVVKYLLNSSPSAKELLNEQDHEGNTPLHLAVLAKD